MGIQAKLAMWLIRYRKYLIPALVLIVAVAVYLIWFR